MDDFYLMYLFTFFKFSTINILLQGKPIHLTACLSNLFKEQCLGNEKMEVVSPILLGTMSGTGDDR